MSKAKVAMWQWHSETTSLRSSICTLLALKVLVLGSCEWAVSIEVSSSNVQFSPFTPPPSFASFGARGVKGQR